MFQSLPTQGTTLFRQSILAFVFILFTWTGSSEAADRASILKSYKKASAFLLKIQNKNGSWGQIPGFKEDGELGMTALAVMALAESPPELRESYKAACAKGATWIIKYQANDGSITQPRTGMATYRTALSLMALQAHDAVKYKDAIAKAQAWLIGAQISDASGTKANDKNYGGWGYGRNKKPNADLSNATMALEALAKSGVPEDSEVYKRALAFLSRCQNNSETNKGIAGLKALNDGGFFYKPSPKAGRDSKTNKDGTVSHDSYGGMTYAGLMSLLHAKLKNDDPRVKAALSWVKKHYTLKKNYGLGLRQSTKNADQAGLYYFYMTFAKCLDTLGSPSVTTEDGKKNWPEDLAAVLMKKQKPAGFWINDANNRWWEGNPLLPTLYALNGLNRVLKYVKGAESKNEKKSEKRRF